ncbi:hypothetical protein TraAM80_05184 [Trypanosoma rangeli]|uniref:Uncharacterized protein n=1 Tax=Trypanosoma rangeli TaxID=5698 RepID=A0A422NG03_TRYRA|nr:uncharacterized protein TraAM80_05184 [Trypanosoma rangeli]RNF04404.1 hypothetical protein TraAM80_05184 [Trypanosoma rangeli]|eukprot:RNF04404.1 hypothetical protein TraAM80_05184 [Trypanosoma rangeli]
MALKVWVKRGGTGDEEALGIHVPLDGTAESVIEACRGVFRHLQPSRVALRTEDGIIVARASPVTALRTHTLELIEVQPEQSLTRRLARDHLTPAAMMAKAKISSTVATASYPVRGDPLVGQRSAWRQSLRTPSSPAPRKTHVFKKLGSDVPVHTKQTEPTSVGTGKDGGGFHRLAALWDSLPAFSYPPLTRSTPAVTGILRAAQRAHGEALESLLGGSSSKPCGTPTSHVGGPKVLKGGEMEASLGQNGPSRLSKCVGVADGKNVRDDSISGDTADKDGSEGLKNIERGSVLSPCDLIAVEEVHTFSFSGAPPCVEAAGTAVAAAAVTEAEAETSPGNESVAGAVETRKTVLTLMDLEEERGRTAVREVVSCGESLEVVVVDTQDNDDNNNDKDSWRANLDELAHKLPTYFEEW